MPNSPKISDYLIPEIQRIMRKQLAAWCNPFKLTPAEIAAVNEIIASSAAARYPNVVEALNAVDLGKALEGSTITGISVLPHLGMLPDRMTAGNVLSSSGPASPVPA